MNHKKIGEKTIEVDARKVAPTLTLKIKVIGLNRSLLRLRVAIALVQIAQWVAGRDAMSVEGSWMDKGKGQ